MGGRSRRGGFGYVRKLPSGRWQASYLGPDLVRRSAPHTFHAKADTEGWLGRRRTRPATIEELEVIVEAMPDRLRALVLLCAWCALHSGEVLELRRSDIDVSAGTVRVGPVLRGPIEGALGAAGGDPGEGGVADPADRGADPERDLLVEDERARLGAVLGDGVGAEDLVHLLHAGWCRLESVAIE